MLEVLNPTGATSGRFKIDVPGFEFSKGTGYVTSLTQNRSPLTVQIEGGSAILTSLSKSITTVVLEK